VFSGGKKFGYSAPPAKWVKRVTGTTNQNEVSDSKKYAYDNNYKGRNIWLILNGAVSSVRKRLRP
jgi:hypothetical protein